MSRLSQNVSANIAGNVWATALALLLTPLYVRLLGVESYGLIGFYVSCTALLGILDTAISATAVRETAWLSARPEEAAKIPSLVRTLEIVYWGIMLALGGLLMVAAWWVGAGWFQTVHLPPASVRTALMLMVLSLIVQVPSGLYLGGLMGLQRQVEGSGLVALFGTVRGIGAIAILSIRPDIRAFFLWQIVASAIQTSAMRWSLIRRVRVGAYPACFSTELLRSVREFAGAMSLVTAFSLVLNQADKMILSRMVSLEAFGLYMLAWTVASGLSRVATPLLQAFSPHFTELASRGDDAALGRQLHLASQLTSALILPPAALLVLLSPAILTAWIGNPVVAAGAAPLLAVLTVGTLLVACSFPALSVLFSQKRLRPIIVLNVAAVVVLLPLLALAINAFGPTGAAFCWVLYGLTIYVAYETLAFRGLPDVGVVSSMARDFVAPGLAAFAVAGLTWCSARQVDGRIETIALLGVGTLTGWAAALFVCRDLFRIAASRFRWNSIATPWSA